MKNSIKNLSIVLLVMAAMLQTGYLWFGANFGHNFFYSVRALASEPEDNQEKMFFSSPYRQISKVSANDFRIRYNYLNTTAIKQNRDQVMKELIQNGKLVSEDGLNWNDVIKRQCIIYDYALPIQTDIFAESFNYKLQKNLSDVGSFEQMIVVPTKNIDNVITVYLINQERKRSYEFAVKVKKSVNDELWLYIEDNIVSELSYISSAESLGRSETVNSFIPNMSNQDFSYNTVYVQNPYYTAGSLLSLQGVEREVDMFFDNPAAKITDTDKSGKWFRYSDDTTVVMYYETDIVEYSKYYPPTKAKNSSTSLLDSYSSAIRFINKDTNVTNDYYLRRYEENQKGYTFYFDYAINNFPIKIPDSLVSETGLTNMIEITVENERVVNYKKYAYTLELSQTYEKITENYLEFIDSRFEAGLSEEDHESVGNLKLCYKFYPYGELTLHWSMNINGNNFMEPAK